MFDNAKILVVEDEAIVALDIKQRLEKMGFTVTGTVATGEAALYSVRSCLPNLILMDIQIKGAYDGVETAGKICEQFDVPVLFLTANSDRATIDRAKSAGPFAYLLKPFEDRELQTTIEIALERHRLERELKEREQWLSVTLSSIGDAIIAFDTKGQVTYLNPVAVQLTGWRTEEAKGKPARDVLKLTLNESMEFKPIEPVEEVLSSGQTLYLPEYALLTRRDGVQLAVEDSAAPIRLGSGELIGVVVILRDVTARILTEKKLHDAEKRVQDLFNTIQEGIGEFDEHEIVQFCNPTFARILGEARPDAVLGRSVLEFVDDESAQLIKTQTNVRRTGKCSCYELRTKRPNGDQRTLQVNATPLQTEQGEYRGAVAAFVDITERKKMEAELHRHRDHLEELVRSRTEELRATGAELQKQLTERMRAEAERHELELQLQKAQKMEALGLLAGGVAHDLNNTLGPLVGYPELILRKLPSDSPLRKMVEKIGRAAEDAASVIQDLLTLARRGRYEMRPLNLNDVVREFVESPAYQRLPDEKPDVSLDLELDDKLPNLLGSAPHLSKVVMNLVVNAFDAITGKGRVRIRTSSRRLDALESGYGNIAKGDYVILRVRDDGCGIAKEDLEKIFEPYFSKKQMGRSGSGLGLSIVYGVVEDHSGYYDVSSTVGAGTEFIIYFPVTKQETETKTESLSGGGNELLLVVDDNDEQRELTTEVLASLGYEIRAVSSGRKAVELLKNQAVDLILLDMIMEPDFDGLDTWEAVRKIRPDQKAIVVSGFSPTERVERLLNLGASSYLKKPYTIDKIAKMVREALDNPAPAVIDCAKSLHSESVAG